jgi:DNA gyrase subunit B
MEMIDSITLLIMDDDIVSTSRENLEKFIRELHRLTTYVKILGVGQKLANFLSEYFICTSTYGGLQKRVEYEHGVFIKESEEKVNKSIHGTTVRFKISSKYINGLSELKSKLIREMIENKAECCPSVTTKFVTIKRDGTTVTDIYKGLTLEQLIAKHNKLTSKTFQFTKESEEMDVRLIFGYDIRMTEGENVLAYCNFIKNNEGGTHVEGFIDGINEFYRKYMQSYLTDKEKKDIQIKKEDIRLGLCACIITTMTTAEFKGQVKGELTSIDMKSFMTKLVKEELKKLPEKDLKELAAIIKSNAKARLSSQRARAQVRSVGNILSDDYISNHIPSLGSYDGDYLEIIHVEGLSAGEHVASAKFEFQEVYKHRGKVDNIFDLSIEALAKLDVVDEMSRILGIPAGRPGNTKYDACKILSDADADGYEIRDGVALIYAKAFPQIIDEGKLFVIVPPLYAYKDGGKQRFAETNRAYMMYRQEKFTEQNSLWVGDKKLQDDQLLAFLLRNENYVDYMDKLAKNEATGAALMELVLSNVRKIGYDKGTVKDWNKLLNNKFSDQVNAIWSDGRVEIEGIKDGNYELLYVDDELIGSKRAKSVMNLLDSNLGKIYNYSVDGANQLNNSSIYEVLSIFGKYKGSDLKRFKGIGQMKPEHLRDRCLDLNKQICKRITWGDIDRSMRQLAMMHSGKAKYAAERKMFMTNYKFDPLDIDT